jgi:methylthioribose-1-phosphate isomerase
VGLRDCRAVPRAQFLARLEQLAPLLVATRPTAVNLRRAVDRVLATAWRTPGDSAEIWDALRREATAIGDEDREMCRRIGDHGLGLLPDGVSLLTHCNAGALATGGIGTALAPVYAAHAAGRRVHVYVDETRPMLQGARLTAWELGQAGVSCTVIADGAAAALLRAGHASLVLVGADRVTANGDVANKIGTYGLALAARHHHVPFYVAAPSSTIDPALPDGAAIPIEVRSPEEVTTLAGHTVAPPGAIAFNPAFDVTPAALVTAFVTDRGIAQPPFRS